MGAGHAHKLYRHAHSPVHELPPHTKLAAVLGFVVVVVSTPREAVWAFAAYAALLAVVAAKARSRPASSSSGSSSRCRSSRSRSSCRSWSPASRRPFSGCR